MFALKSNGELWAWGRNFDGELGINATGSSSNKSSPVLIVGNHSFIQIGGQDKLRVRKSNGGVWGSGVNGEYELGDGTWTDRSSPVLVIGNHSFVSIASTYKTSHGLKVDGSMWSWGQGGKIGDNTTTDRSSPVLVVGNHSFAKIVCTFTCSGALKSDGAAWLWGDNSFGSIGDNTTTMRSSPVLVVGSHSFIDIAGGSHTVALKADGSVWAWGHNSGGQLGDNTVDDKSSPVLVVGNHSFVKVTALVTARVSLALKANGQVWSWGENGTGELGDGTTDNKSSPVLVVGNHSFIDIAAGTAAIALKANGEVWGWGYNWDGNLGDGTRTDRSSPVLVVGNHSFASLSYLGPFLYYKTASTPQGIEAASWNQYTDRFDSLGYVKVKIEAV